MRNKIGQFVKGNKHTEAVLKKMSDAKKGKPSWNKGKKLSKEHIEKLKKAHIGKHSGKDNPAWKGGITPYIRRLRRSSKYYLWRDSIFERDKYICQMPGCDKVERYLNAHHIKKFADYPELRFDINNGITLCRDCHNKTKRKEKQYEDLFKEIIKNIKL